MKKLISFNFRKIKKSDPLIFDLLHYSSVCEFDIADRRIIIKPMKQQFTAVYKKTGKWHSAWIEEIPGVNTQGRTLKEARENLKEALLLVLESNRLMMKPRNKEKVLREPLTISV